MSMKEHKKHLCGRHYF